jgi:hypothetical protein
MYLLQAIVRTAITHSFQNNLNYIFFIYEIINKLKRVWMIIVIGLDLILSLIGEDIILINRFNFSVFFKNLNFHVL